MYEKVRQDDRLVESYRKVSFWSKVVNLGNEWFSVAFVLINFYGSINYKFNVQNTLKS